MTLEKINSCVTPHSCIYSVILVPAFFACPCLGFLVFTTMIRMTTSATNTIASIVVRIEPTSITVSSVYQERDIGKQ